MPNFTHSWLISEYSFVNFINSRLPCMHKIVAGRMYICGRFYHRESWSCRANEIVGMVELVAQWLSSCSLLSSHRWTIPQTFNYSINWSWIIGSRAHGYGVRPPAPGHLVSRRVIKLIKYWIISFASSGPLPSFMGAFLVKTICKMLEEWG